MDFERDYFLQNSYPILKREQVFTTKETLISYASSYFGVQFQDIDEVFLTLSCFSSFISAEEITYFFEPENGMAVIYNAINRLLKKKYLKKISLEKKVGQTKTVYAIAAAGHRMIGERYRLSLPRWNRPPTFNIHAYFCGMNMIRLFSSGVHFTYEREVSVNQGRLFTGGNDVLPVADLDVMLSLPHKTRRVFIEQDMRQEWYRELFKKILGYDACGIFSPDTKGCIMLFSFETGSSAPSYSKERVEEGDLFGTGQYSALLKRALDFIKKNGKDASYFDFIATLSGAERLRAEAFSASVCIPETEGPEISASFIRAYLSSDEMLVNPFTTVRPLLESRALCQRRMAEMARRMVTGYEGFDLNAALNGGRVFCCATQLITDCFPYMDACPDGEVARLIESAVGGRFSSFSYRADEILVHADNGIAVRFFDNFSWVKNKSHGVFIFSPVWCDVMEWVRTYYLFSHVKTPPAAFLFVVDGPEQFRAFTTFLYSAGADIEDKVKGYVLFLDLRSGHVLN